MKKLIYCALALAAGLFAASCQQENLEPVQGGNTVTFTVEIPEVATKADAVGDDANMINDLVYAVYVTEAESLDEAKLDWDGTKTKLLYAFNSESERFENGTDVISLELLNNQNHIVLLWAQNADTWVDEKGSEINLRNITYPSDMKLNAENADKYAAFYAVKFIPSTERVNNGKIELTRPFAQINIATADPGKYNVNVEKTVVTVNGAGDAFDVAKEQAADNADVTYEWTGKVYTNAFTVAGNDYDHYIAMNYVFAKDAVEVSYTIDTDYGKGINNTISNVPVKKNFRTNIVGNLLTSNVSYDIVLDKDWGLPELAPDPIYLAAAIGGEVTLDEDIVLTKPLEVVASMTINLNDHTISGEIEKGNGAIVNIADGASVILNGGTIKNTAVNGDAAINNEGTLVLNGVTIEGAPLADGGYSAYAVISSGYMVIEEGTAISADRGSLKVTGDGETIINGGTFTNNDIGSCSLTSHVVDVEDGSTNKLTINGGTFQHLHTATSGGVVICNRTRGTVYVNGGNFSGGNYYGNNNLSDYGYGGTFSVKGGVYTAKPAAKYIATGYKAVPIDDKFHVLPEVVADAATAANVTAVTESTADVATALTTDNGEATMFMWNDVAYIAKYGEVVITSSADDATTARGVVENAAGLKTATVAEGIEVVGNRTFRKCANLETVEFPNTLTEIGPAVFQSCSKLANVTIPASVTTIGEGAFAECTSLTSINIPSGVTRIEADALRATGLVSVEFHEGVTYFGAQAFRDCKQLKEVIINAPSFTVEPNAFGVMAGALPGTTIYVANSEMKEYLKNTLAYKNQFTIVVPGLVNNAEELKDALADETKEIITLAAGVTFEGTFEVNRNVKIVSENVASDDEATIKGRVEVRSANPTFENVSFDRNETDSNNAMQTASNALQYKAVVMIYGDQNNKVTFKECNFYNNNGTHQSAITNVAVDLVVDKCYFEGRSSSIYSQANLSVTNSTFNYTGGNNVILSINGCGANGGKVIFKENNISGEKIFALSQFLSTVDWIGGTYHFDVQGNTGAGFDYYFLNTGKVENKTFADGSETF